jgi:hypothetical protein
MDVDRHVKEDTDREQSHYLNNTNTDTDTGNVGDSLLITEDCHYGWRNRT